MRLQAFIVEDSPPIRESLVEALTELAGIQIAGEAATAKDAITWLRNTANEWQLAVVDLLLDGEGSGLDVLRAIQDRPAGRKVLVLTATASNVVRDQCVALGSDGVFDKSMDTDALLDWCIRFANEPR